MASIYEQKIISDNFCVLKILSYILTKHNLISIYDKKYNQGLIIPNPYNLIFLLQTTA